MSLNFDRIKRAQILMKEHDMIGIMIMNYDDYIYFFGEKRVQPRAIIPASGLPIFICFKAEEPELKKMIGVDDIKIFSHVGEQISDVRKTFQALFNGPPPGMSHKANTRPRVGMQMWFHTPAFLVDMFRKVNRQIELVSSDPVMDELRMVKGQDEIEKLCRSQQIAAKGMDCVRDMLEPGITGHEIATEVLYIMMKEGASGTSTPIHINSGIRSCWIHGKADNTVINEGELVVVDLTPQYEGYCANLARTFVVGKPDDKQELLIDTYIELINNTRLSLKPGVTVSELDRIGKEICAANGLDEYHLNGISHGIGLRFEETPASTIIPAHRSLELRENMTITIGHTILAIPGYGGVRFEDIYLVTPEGGKILYEYPF